MPAIILANMGNADINRVLRHPYSIPVLRRFDKLVSPPSSGDSDGLEESQLDTALGAIYNESLTKRLYRRRFRPLLNSLAGSWVTLVDKVRDVFDLVV